MADRQLQSRLSAPRSPKRSLGRPPQAPAVVDLAPMGISWPAYRNVIRLELLICIQICLKIAFLCHDLPGKKHLFISSFHVATAFALIVVMIRSWRRKRMPSLMLWSLLVFIAILYGEVMFFGSIRDGLNAEELKKMKELEQLRELAKPAYKRYFNKALKFIW